MSQALRAAVVLHSIGPYHRARILASRRRRPDIRFISLAGSEVLRDWPSGGDVDGVLTLADGALERTAAATLRKEVRRVLESLAPDVVVIAGYAHPAMREAAGWARHKGRAVVLMSDSQREDHRRSVLRELLKRAWLARHVDAAFVSGSAAAAYVAELGVPRWRIWRGYDVVDNEYFAEPVPVRVAALREALGLPRRYLLFVGRLAAEKNLEVLLRAYARFRESEAGGPPSWGLVIAGAGPRLNALQALADRLSAPDVRLVGFHPPEGLRALYQGADALVLPSTSEPWGLVVNEAMAAGLPVLASTRCGAARDLVFQGVNGYLFDPRNEASLVQALQRLWRREDDLAAMGAESRVIVAPLTPDAWACVLADCVDAMMEERGEEA